MAICALTNTNVTITGASRTDAGVSALAQTALVQLDTPIPTENLAKAITDRLPADIAVTDLTDDEADLFMLTYDPIGALAQMDGAEIEKLVASSKAIENAGYNVDEILDTFDYVIDVPDFQPVDESEQPRLDQKKPVICPECGNEFVVS